MEPDPVLAESPQLVPERVPTLRPTRQPGGRPELLREVANYENECRLCYLRGPAGITVAPAEQVG